MSSTNRGGNRHAADYYVTPPAHVRNFLVNWFDDMIEDKEDFMEPYSMRRWVLDPCAGGDAEHGMTYPDVINEWTGMFSVFTMDIRQDSKAVWKEDYLKTFIGNKMMGVRPDLIISNPPFSLAEQFISKAIIDVSNFGYVVMLLRLNFLEGRKRFRFLKSFPPQRVYVHARRMSFTGKGADSVAYAHFVWKKGKYPVFAKTRVIDFED